MEYRAPPLRGSRSIFLGVLFLAVVALAPECGEAFTWPWRVGKPWPKSSTRPVDTLDHPSLEERIAALSPGPETGYRFAVFGDQRALADGEWQALLRCLATVASADPRLLFVLDTGDIVWDGRHADQFHLLREILSPVRGLPYLVGVGNHEVRDNSSITARRNAAAFLRYLDDGISEERLYYRKEIGPASVLFLDSNDFVYGDSGAGGDAPCPPPRGRAARQLEWLVEELNGGVPPSSGSIDPLVTIVVMHHPFLQTSSKHADQARALWAYRHEGRALPDILADGGVDLVLVGHTHTYERFRLERADGRAMALVNVSGRPRASLLWIGDGARRARDIRGREARWLAGRGWTGLDRWRVTQEDVMARNESDQFALITVGADGGLVLEMRFLDEEGAGGCRSAPAVRLR